MRRTFSPLVSCLQAEGIKIRTLIDIRHQTITDEIVRIHNHHILRRKLPCRLKSLNRLNTYVLIFGYDILLVRLGLPGFQKKVSVILDFQWRTILAYDHRSQIFLRIAKDGPERPLQTGNRFWPVVGHAVSDKRGNCKQHKIQSFDNAKTRTPFTAPRV